MNIPITDSIMRIDTNRDNFNMQDIENRRFMFNPKTATLILGYQYRNGELVSSHADEYTSTGTGEPFDDFVRGWIGTSKEYTDGVIHFAPSVSEKNITLFEKAFDTLEMFKNNGARKNTVVRGLGRAWEQPFSDLIKEVDLMAENISSVTPIEFTGKSQKEKVKEITDKLEQGIKDLFNSDRYKEYLSAMSKFHNYSFRNTILILMQKPGASYIAGFNTWKNEFKRAVRKGEKGIKILAPAPYKKEIEETAHDKNGNPILNADGSNRTTTKTITVPAFKITTVFDLSQTDGKEIPTIANQLTGNVEDYEKFFKALKEISPVPIELEKIDRAANGYYHLTEKRIAVRNDLSEMQTIKTAIHEIAHAKLHDIDLNAPKDEQQPRVDRRTREVEAESGQKVTNCYQCGNCTAGCPCGPEYDLQVSQVMRAVQLGNKEMALSSRSLWLCVSCSTCTSRCPNNIDVAEVMETLRHMARKEGRVAVPKVEKFWFSFLDTVRKFGRTYEIGTMVLYMLRSLRVFTDVDLAPQALAKQKLGFKPHSIPNGGAEAVGRIMTRYKERAKREGVRP